MKSFLALIAISVFALSLAVFLTDRYAGVVVNAEHGTVSFTFWPWVVLLLVLIGVVSGAASTISLFNRK